MLGGPSEPCPNRKVRVADGSPLQKKNPPGMAVFCFEYTTILLNRWQTGGANDEFDTNNLDSTVRGFAIETLTNRLP